MSYRSKIMYTWLGARDDKKKSKLLDSLGFDTSPTKPICVVRLRINHMLACGLCRLIWDIIEKNADCRMAIEAAEVYAENECTYATLCERSSVVERWFEMLSNRRVPGRIIHAALAVIGTTAMTFSPDSFVRLANNVEGAAKGERDLVALRRSIGSLIASVAGDGSEFDAAWRTSTATQLAGHIYSERDFSLMPILADALQDAGCDKDELLTDMRDPNAQWCRGSRVLDEVLDKRSIKKGE